MKKESKCVSTKKSTKHKEDSNEGNEEQKSYKTQKANNKMIRVSLFLSIITLNINGLIFPIKRYRLAEWMQKHDTTRSCL